MSVVARTKKKLSSISLTRFGEMKEFNSRNYWREYQYWGPLQMASPEPQGKFVIRAPLETVRKYAEKLKPYVRRNEIMGMKHPIRENPPGDEFFGTSVLIVYTTKKRRQAVEEILKKEGIPGATWTEEKPTVDIFDVLHDVQSRRESELMGRRDKKRKVG
ncbi:MAG: hypothetical protein NT157_03790 [Candidatus Micrarchaeota archaeon]|nr:hypothetical protein [Candidatus Micrarchaeota archaeon]